MPPVALKKPLGRGWSEASSRGGAGREPNPTALQTTRPPRIVGPMLLRGFHPDWRVAKSSLKGMLFGAAGRILGDAHLAVRSDFPGRILPARSCVPLGRGRETLTRLAVGLECVFCACAYGRLTAATSVFAISGNFRSRRPNVQFSRVGDGDQLSAAKSRARIERRTRGTWYLRGRGWIASGPWPLVHA